MSNTVQHDAMKVKCALHYQCKITVNVSADQIKRAPSWSAVVNQCVDHCVDQQHLIVGAHITMSLNSKYGAVCRKLLYYMVIWKHMSQVNHISHTVIWKHMCQVNHILPQCPHVWLFLLENATGYLDNSIRSLAQHISLICARYLMLKIAQYTNSNITTFSNITTTLKWQILAFWYHGFWK